MYEGVWVRTLGLTCTLVEQNKNVLLLRSDRSGNLCVHRPGVITMQALSEEDRRLWMEAMDGREPVSCRGYNWKKAHMFVQEHMSPQPIKFSLPVQNNIINRANPVTPYLSLFILVGGCCIMQACMRTKTRHSFHILWIINYCEIHLKAM